MQNSHRQLTHNRIKWIDVLRGLCMLAILVYHTEVYYKEAAHTPYYVYTSNAIALFYFLSGYLFYTQQAFDLKRKLHSIVHKLVVPYFVFTLLIMAPKMLIRGEEIEWGAMLWQIATGRASWFIASLITAEVVFSLLLCIRCSKRSLLLAITGVASFACFALINIPFTQNIWQWHEALLAVSFLAIGWLAHWQENNIHRINRPLYLLFIFILLIIIKLYEYRTYGNQLKMNGIAVTNYAVFWLDMFCTIYGFTALFSRLESRTEYRHFTTVPGGCEESRNS